jgi:hypothetical protein
LRGVATRDGLLSEPRFRNGLDVFNFVSDSLEDRFPIFGNRTFDEEGDDITVLIVLSDAMGKSEGKAHVERVIASNEGDIGFLLGGLR